MIKRLGILLPGRVYRAVQLCRSEQKLKAAAGRQPRAPHGLPGELIVSLTSYPPRFGVVHLTLRSILNQTVRPDRIILWVATSDADAVTRKMNSLVGEGVEIRYVPNVQSYKKLVFALSEFPEAFIATADDDVCYPVDWLEILVEGYKSNPGFITCHRAHRLTSIGSSTLAPYMSWEWDVQDVIARHPSIDLLPTGLAGILYPPHSLHPDVTNSALFMELCPTADDLWFYWMARRAGTMYRKVGGVFEHYYWPGTQDEALFDHNSVENDHQLRKLVDQFGMPLSM
jgi:hypothetical protein